MPIHDRGAARYSGCCVPAVRVAHGAPREAKRRGGVRPLGIAGARSWPPSRPVLPEYAPSSCYGGSRAAEVASRGRGRPRRAQERRGRTRVAPRCGGDGSIRPVARTLRVGRRNHRRRASPVGLSRVGLSSQRRRHRQVLPDAARCPPRGRGSRPGRQIVPASPARGAPGGRSSRGSCHATPRRSPGQPCAWRRGLWDPTRAWADRDSRRASGGAATSARLERTWQE